MLLHVFVPRYVADLVQLTPIDRDRRQTEGLTVVGERVEEAVRGDVISLGGSSDHRADRREEHEEVERRLEGVHVQVPCPLHFGPHDFPETLDVELSQERIVEHHRRMEDATKRGQRPPHAPQESSQTAFSSATSSLATVTRAFATTRRPHAARDAAVDAPRSAGEDEMAGAVPRDHSATARPKPPRPPVTR